MKTTKSSLKSYVASGLVLISLLYSAGCDSETHTSVKVERGPSFVFAGNGRLASFTVSAPLEGQKIAFPCNERLFSCSGVASVIWQIEAEGGYFKGTRIHGLNLSFGTIPPGYRQTVPNQPLTPRLAPSAIYAYSAETTDAAVRNGYFYVDRSGSVQVVDPDLCMSSIEGHEVRVYCTSKNPFQEPSDLDAFVRDHQVH